MAFAGYPDTLYVWVKDPFHFRHKRCRTNSIFFRRKLNSAHWHSRASQFQKYFPQTTFCDIYHSAVRQREAGKTPWSTPPRTLRNRCSQISRSKEKHTDIRGSLSIPKPAYLPILIPCKKKNKQTYTAYLWVVTLHCLGITAKW